MKNLNHPMLRIITLLLFSMLLYACNLVTKNNDNDTALNNAVNNNYHEFSTKEKQLVDYVSHSLKKNNGPLVQALRIGIAESLANNSATDNNISSLNTQESEVFEGDRQLNDGESLFALSVRDDTQDSTASLMHWSLADGQRQSTLQLSDYHQELFKHDNTLISLNKAVNWWSSWLNFSYWYQNDTSFQWYDFDANKKINKSNHWQVDGQIIRSVQIGHYLYSVLKHTPNIDTIAQKVPHQYAQNSEQEEANLNYFQNNITLESLIPKWRLNGDELGAITTTDNCQFITTESTQHHTLGLLFIISTDMTKPQEKPQAQCVVGNVETVYASANALYLSSSEYDYNANTSTVDNTQNASPWIPPEYHVKVHRFNLRDNNVQYQGSAKVDGYIPGDAKQKAFRFSQRDDNHLAVISYVGYSQEKNQSQVKLTILNFPENSTQAQVIATLPNEQHPASLGKPGEMLYATRYTKDKAYLVTFDKTDPLYAIDISDVTNPIKLSELEITGFSDYLHPLPNNQLLGIGKEATTAQTFQDESGGFSWFLGVKISLFDQQGEELKETDKVVIGQRGSNSPILNNHHTFTYLDAHEKRPFRFAAPIQVHQSTANVSSNATSPAYYYWTKSVIQLYEVEDKLTLLKEIPLKQRDETSNAYQYDNQMHHTRVIMSSDTVWVLYGNTLLSQSIP